MDNVIELLTRSEAIIVYAITVLGALVEIIRRFRRTLRDNSAKLAEMVSQLTAAEQKLAQEETRRATDDTKPAVMLDPDPTQDAPQEPPTCANCKHWDQEEGQAAIAQNPVFRQAAAFLSPAQMTARAKYNEAGDRIEEPSSPLPAKTSWADVGACMLNEECTFKIHTCDKHERRP